MKFGLVLYGGAVIVGLGALVGTGWLFYDVLGVEESWSIGAGFLGAIFGLMIWNWVIGFWLNVKYKRNMATALADNETSQEGS